MEDEAVPTGMDDPTEGPVVDTEEVPEDATPPPSKQRFSGMRGYSIVWFGQMISFIGTGMTQFGLIIWVWQETGSAISLSLMAFFGFVPMVVMMPFAGVLVDRWNLKWTIALVDLTAGLATIGMLILFGVDVVEVWHLYILVMFAGLFQAFQFPAFSTATTMMVAKKHYGRASGMLMTAQALSMILAPIFAAILLGVSSIEAIFMVDVITFTVALGLLALVPIPQPPREDLGKATVKSVVRESAFGFRFIWSHKGLLGLQLILFAFNVIATFGLVLMSPMILSKSDDNELMLGSVLAIGAIGGVIGGVAMSIHGGPKKRVHGVFIGLAIAAVGGIILGLGNDIWGWALGVFVFMSTIALCNGSNQAIWQSKVAPEFQGRVFATRGLIAMMGVPISQLLAGPLAEYWAEPFMEDATGLLEFLFGSGPGAGMALIIFLVGVGGVIIGLAGYLFPGVRNVETLMPDHDKAAEEEKEEAKEKEPEEPVEPTPLEELEQKLDDGQGHD
ncbi:MAG: MFS transporter [Thermoplasmata archaeon]|nr:MFS transporter [Thermoplasmata archaeon]